MPGAQQFGAYEDETASDALRESMAEHLTDRGVFYDSAAWLL